MRPIIRSEAYTLIDFSYSIFLNAVRNGEARKEAEKIYIVNTSFVHTIVVLQTYVCAHLLFACARLTGRLERGSLRGVVPSKEDKDFEPAFYEKPSQKSWIVLNVMWILCMLFYVQICSSCFSRPKHLSRRVKEAKAMQETKSQKDREEFEEDESYEKEK